MNGCAYVRDVLPARLLRDKFGYDIKFILLPTNWNTDPRFPREPYDWADIIVFNRHYDADVGPSLTYLKGRKPIVYETDDDLESLLKQHHKDIIDQALTKNINSIKMLTLSADAVIVSTPYLAQRIQKVYKPFVPVYVIYNHIDLDFYMPGIPHRDLRIGWSGGSTHPGDLLDTGCIDAVIKLQKKYNFMFYLQGITSNPYSAYAVSWQQTIKSGLYNPKLVHPEVYATIELWERMQKMKQWVHIPFYPVQLFPSVMRQASLDIGLCPIIEDEFNKSRSCNKFYEYAAFNATTIASDVMPYTEEVTYRVPNNMDAWYEGIERLIRDKKFRKKLLAEQQEFVFLNRNAENYAALWHEVFQKLEVKK